MTISLLLQKYWLNYWLIIFFLNWLEWVDTSWCDLDQREPSWNICDSKLQNFQLKNYFHAQHFQRFFALKVFTFTFHCTIPQKSPICDIRSSDERIKYFKVACTVRIWDRGHDGSLWVHPSAVINIPLGSGNISTTIQTPKGEVVPVTVYRYSCLVWVDDDWLNCGVCQIFCVNPE